MSRNKPLFEGRLLLLLRRTGVACMNRTRYLHKRGD